jgi:hypothetical protein
MGSYCSAQIDIHVQLEAAQERASARLPCVPSYLHAERSYNPFWRCDVPGIKTAVANSFPNSSALPTLSDVECMAKLRELKNGNVHKKGNNSSLRKGR